LQQLQRVEEFCSDTPLRVGTLQRPNGLRSFERRGCGHATREFGGKATNGQAEIGPHQEGSAECGYCGDSLAWDARGFAGVGETNPRAETATAAVAGEGLPANLGGGFSGQSELGTLVWTASAGIGQ